MSRVFSSSFLASVLLSISIVGGLFCGEANAQTATTATLAQNSENPQEMQSTVANKRLVIANLKAIQSKLNSQIAAIDSKIKEKLKDTQDVRITDDATNTAIRMTKLEEGMAELEVQRRESLERTQFLDRIIFAIDTKWTSNTFKVFLEQSLLDIAAAEMNQTEANKPSNLWKFCTYLSVAVREFPEPREDLVGFLDNYMTFSSVLNPKSPTAFAEARSYTNGIVSQAANTTKQEDLGDGVEKKVRTAPTDEKPAVSLGTTSAPAPAIEPAQPTNVPAVDPQTGNSTQQK